MTSWRRCWRSGRKPRKKQTKLKMVPHGDCTRYAYFSLSSSVTLSVRVCQQGRNVRHKPVPASAEPRVINQMSESFAQLFEQSLASQKMRPGAIVSAIVVEIRPDVVIVNAGLKSESAIPIEQFREAGEPMVTVGETIEVALEMVEDGFGETRLSREKARRARTWIYLEKALEAGQTVKGILTGKVKGGFTVEIDDVRAFLPGSLVDVRPVRDPSYLENKELEFKVVKLDRRRNNVVVSRRAVVEQESGAERESLLENLQEGQVIKGIVKNLTDYGAFVDLGGVDGLLHITDIAWKRVKQPSEVVNVGDEIDVKVLKFDRERQRVSLGLKQLGEDPWVDIARRYPVSTRLFGKVTNIADYGCFVGLDGGIDGLLHLSDLSWTVPGEEAVRNYKKGDEVQAIVLAIDAERERISLGVKQLEQDPWSNYVADHPKGTIVNGIVKEVDAKGAIIELAEGVEGTLRASELTRDRIEDARTVLNVGDKVEAKFMGVDRKNRSIILSIKAKDTDEEAEVLEGYSRSAASGGTNLGDLLKEQMGNSNNN